MRGKLVTVCPARQNARITPADAGKTSTAASRERMRQDHPRGCGENYNWDWLAADPEGSPPRMRGKRNYNMFPYDEIRITPADAGKTRSLYTRHASVQDHPRGCGEN